MLREVTEASMGENIHRGRRDQILLEYMGSPCPGKRMFVLFLGERKMKQNKEASCESTAKR